MSDDGWERRTARALELLPWVTLGVSTVIAVLSIDVFGATRSAVGFVLVAAAAAWLLGWRRWVRGEEARDAAGGCTAGSTAGRAYYWGRSLLAFAMTWCNPFFAIFAFVGYLDPFRFLRTREAYAGMVLTALTLAGSQSGGLPPQSGPQLAVFLALLVLNAGLAGGFATITLRDERLSRRRAADVVALEAANARLEAALVENAALQAELVVRAREAGVLDERQRLAREIHDTIAQDLAGVLTQLEAAATADDAAEVRRRVEVAARQARDGLVEARRSVEGLRPAALDGAGDGAEALPDALARVVDRWRESAGIAAEVTTCGAVQPLHPEVEATLLRVAQEALANVARHAGASRVGVTLSYMGDDVSLDVRDDGAGFATERVPGPRRANGAAGPLGRTGFGLEGMRQRVRRVAGELDVESEPGGGTAVSARVPAVGRG